MGRTVTASGGNMYQLQLSKPMQLKFCGTLTYTVIGARKPDITIVDQIKKEVLFVDVSILADKRVGEKENEKISEYNRDLKIEVEQWIYGI